MATSPICRCRVLYLGSAVPHATKDGLQGIQEPLRDLYPEQGTFSAKGIDSWLSVWSNGLLLENVDESMRQVTRFFSIEQLHYCAAVSYTVVPGNNGEHVQKFLPLDSPFTRHSDSNHAPLFACILRRTEGIKVLECHAFICKKEAAANALVRCCFHSYADSMQAKHLEENSYYSENNNNRSRSVPGLNTLEKVEVWRSNAETVHVQMTNGSSSVKAPSVINDPIETDEEDNENYRVWNGVAPTDRELVYVDTSGTLGGLKSGNATIRSSRMKVRQMMGSACPPPPRPPLPVNLQLQNEKDSKGKTKSKSKSKKKSKELAPVIPNTSGRPVNGFRPTSAFDAFRVIVPQQQTIYNGSGLCTERRVRRISRPPLAAYEEPIYFPLTRPTVPSYQLPPFSPKQYCMQYGTAPRNKIIMGDPNSRKFNQQNVYQTPQIYQNQPCLPERKVNGHINLNTVREGHDHGYESSINSEIYKQKGHKQHEEKDSDSDYTKGIYKKKGHLNERAFSYSIRQEHRSRSNSIANLQFFQAENQENLDRHRPGSKDQELVQLVNALNLKPSSSVELLHSRCDFDIAPRPESSFLRRKAPAY